MNLIGAKKIMIETHLDAIDRNERAVGIVMESPPGIGKTDTGFDYCRDLARILSEPVGLVHEMFATFTSADVRGFMIPVKSPVPGELPQTVFSLPPWYPVHANTYVFMPDGKMFRRGEYTDDLPDVGVLYIDELGQADEEVQKPSAELIYRGTVGTTDLPPRWRVIAATNRTSDRSGVIRQLMFLVNRRLLIKVEGEIKPWVEWNDSLPAERKVHEILVTFAQQHPGIVFRDSVPDGTDPFCTPRTLVMTDRVLRALQTQADIDNDTLPMDDLAREAAAGLLGEGTAGQLFAHMRFYKESPTLEEIEADWEKARMPKGRDGQMVCCYMLARRVTEDNASAVVKYVGRMDNPMQILACGVFNGDARCQKVLLATREYQNLLFKHKDVLVASES